MFCLVSFTLDVGFGFLFHSSMYFSVPGLVLDFFVLNFNLLTTSDEISEFVSVFKVFSFLKAAI